MANELPYYNWGQDFPAATYGSELAVTALIGVPRAPACLHFISALSGNYMMKYRTRCHYEIDTDDAYHVTFFCDGSSEFDEYLLAQQTPSPDWDSESDEATAQAYYPDEGKNFNPQWPRTVVLPYSLFEVSYWAPVSHAAMSGRVNGLEVSVGWDEAYDGSDLPVWDWSDAAISDTQMPASSVLMMKAIVESYNRIVYGSSWMIQAAMPGDDDRAPA